MDQPYEPIKSMDILSVGSITSELLHFLTKTKNMAKFYLYVFVIYVGRNGVAVHKHAKIVVLT